MGLFGKKKPKLQNYSVHSNGRWNINLDTDASDQANMKAYIHPRVPDFRVQQSLSAVASLHPTADAVIVKVDGKKVGTLPSYWQAGGRELIRRAIELNAGMLLVGCLFEWNLKAGPFQPILALGHSANANTVTILPADQVEFR